MAATKYYRAQIREEGSESVLPEEEEFWEEHVEAEGGGTGGGMLFVASLLLDADVLAEAEGRARGGLGRVEVRKVILREA